MPCIITTIHQYKLPLDIILAHQKNNLTHTSSQINTQAKKGINFHKNMYTLKESKQEGKVGIHF